MVEDPSEVSCAQPGHGAGVRAHGLGGQGVFEEDVENVLGRCAGHGGIEISQLLSGEP
ncbi:hypothetical protein [Streptomyces sp. NPDC088789]|uniref:hypothetical protein n=1 Tax=Streptomyces sp. NPDC088789 TaxID=3365899 RepID=UPI00380F3178